MERRGRKSVAETHGKKALYCLKTMEGIANKLKQELNYKEYTGFEMCMQIFKEHYQDIIKTTQNDNE